MATERQSSPPPQTGGSAPRAPLTPEQLRRIEVNRMKAIALREQRQAEQARATEGKSTTGVKRTYSSMTASETPTTVRDAAATTSRPLDAIRPARNFTKYVEYDFSKITDTKGGFLTEEDDRDNKALHVRDEKAEQKPPQMTQKEWERQQLLKTLHRERAGPFEPGLSVLDDRTRQKKCRECGSLEIDWKWEESLRCCICHACKDKFPEKYSLLTKTEAREDYLLTNPELQDEELLPHLERPNPHKSTWNNMMLYLRYQVEEYAFSAKKWGSPEALDAEFERRETEKKRRREAKFKGKLEDLKKRTRVDAYRRNRQGAAGGNFGDDLGNGGRHVHQWGRSIEDPKTGIGVKKCVDCGMEVEELEF
ncbi:DNA repair protein RAD14 [Aspergillus ibericus CBS 121593]|uniref:DNA repair protein RAD14 n=1 Tax=Aspergillus ibericus CBS 121593 TaxID=1448316 RepID=A0A395H2T3_9EURO|nr:DNA repair protein [Aspergillus ibericus CBS 121593]RAL02192.1 DNA repair protein [Aspergillus ibericus CBS 121593]